jgi:iron-sulfur cluster assembly accessory protein
MAEPPDRLSASAAARVAAIAERQGKPPILRLAVEGGGCAGFSYRFGLADEVAPDDLTTIRDGVTLVVDEMTHDLVRGGEVDSSKALAAPPFRSETPTPHPDAAAGRASASDPCGRGASQVRALGEAP